MLPPRRVQAYRRFVEWQAIAAAQHSGEQLPELARLKQQLLHELLPELADTDSSEAAIGELQSLADAALSAAVSHKAPPGRLARALTLMNIAWVRRCWLQLVSYG
jgi:cell division septum initiation protein DivIVA